MAIKAVIHNGGRQPIFQSSGNGKNSQGKPLANAPAIIYTGGRKPLKK